MIAHSYTNSTNILPSLPSGSVELYLGLFVTKRYSNWSCREEVWVNRSTTLTFDPWRSTPCRRFYASRSTHVREPRRSWLPDSCAVPEDLHASQTGSSAARSGLDQETSCSGFFCAQERQKASCSWTSHDGNAAKMVFKTSVIFQNPPLPTCPNSFYPAAALF